MKKNRRKTKKFFLILVSYIISLLFLMFAHHCFDFLGMGKQSWSEILHDLWLYCIGALAICVMIIFTIESDE